MTQDHRGKFDRRTILKLTGAAGISGLAGCTGENPGDQPNTDPGEDGGSPSGSNGSGDGSGGQGGQDIRMLATGESSLSFAATQGIATIVNENSDEITISARPSPGPAANIGALDRDEADWVLADFWVLRKVLDGEDPYGEISYTPQIIHHFYDVQWFLATNREGWTHVSDIASDARVSPAPRGVSSREMLIEAMSYSIGEDYEARSVEHGQMGPALNEGRVDVQASGLVNRQLEAGWLQQAKSMVDLRVLNWESSVVEELKNHPGMTLDDIDMSSFEGYAHTPDVLHSLALPFHYIAKPEADGELIYNYLETFYGQRDADLGDYHALLNSFGEDSYWTQFAQDIPFHPAAADFYQDNDLWQDEFVRGGE